MPRRKATRSSRSTRDAELGILRSVVCRCGAEKVAGRALCLECYLELDMEQRGKLTRRVGRGFLRGYEEAVESLNA